MNSTASTAVEYIRKLYKAEKDLEKSKASTNEIYKVHQEKSIPIFSKYNKWLETQIKIFLTIAQMEGLTLILIGANVKPKIML